MAKQIFRQMKAEGDDLEWLYVPDVVYAEYETCKRCLQLIIPYRHVRKTEETFPLVIFIPGSAWYRQEVYNSSSENNYKTLQKYGRRYCLGSLQKNAI